MIRSLESKNVRWLYALRPTPEELATLNDTITLPPLLIEELTIPSHRPKVAIYDHSIYLIMKILTIMAFATFPLMLFTSLFGMNTATLPIVGSPHDFWIIVGIIVFATAAMFSFFKN